MFTILKQPFAFCDLILNFKIDIVKFLTFYKFAKISKTQIKIQISTERIKCWY